MNSIFLDSLAVDIERLERINRTISAVPRERLRQMGLTLHHVDVLVHDALGAARRDRACATCAASRRPIRFLLRSVGAMRRGGANLASYLLFEQGYCRELIALGYHDTMKRREEVEAFLGGAMCPVPGRLRAHREVLRPAPEGPRRTEEPDGPTRPPRPRRLSPRARDHHALDGQRRLRAREQRRLLLVLRHGRERLADPPGAARRREGRGHRPGRRDRLPLLRVAHLPGDGDRGDARGARRQLERALRDRAVRRGPGRRPPRRGTSCTSTWTARRGARRRCPRRGGGRSPRWAPRGRRREADRPARGRGARACRRDRRQPSRPASSGRSCSARPSRVASARSSW